MDRKIGKRIHYLANQNRAYVNSLLKEDGLTHGECNIIAEVYHQEGLSQEELRKILRIDKSAITRMLKNVIEKGYVRKEIDKQDRRYSHLYLTQKTIDKVPHIFDIFAKSANWLLDGLSDQEVVTIIGLLDKMCDTIRKKVD